MHKKILFIGLTIIISTLCLANDSRHFILGKEQGEGNLIYPWHIQEGPDGNIYVMDQGDAYIKVYSPEGNYLKRIGGKGQGPGEIQRADGANFGFTLGGKLYFTEFFGGHKWITLIDLSARLDKVIHPDIEQAYGINNSFSLEDGGFIIEAWYSSIPEIKRDYFLYHYPQSLLRIDSTGKIISEIVKANYFKTISASSSGADQWLPYVPAFAWTPYDKELILFSDGLNNKLKVFTYSGSFINEIRTELPEPEPVKDSDLNEWRRTRREAIRDSSWFNTFGKVINQYKNSLYDKKPILDNIFSTPDENILIERSVKEEGTKEFWLIDRNGKTIIKTDIAT